MADTKISALPAATAAADANELAINEAGTSKKVTVAQLRSQVLIGGSAVGSNLTYKSTTGVGTATGAAHIFTGGTDGGTTIATLLNNGNVGIADTTPDYKLDVNGEINAVTAFRVADTQVVGAQGAVVADASGGAVVDAEARTALNALLARLRTHGLIAT